MRFYRAQDSPIPREDLDDLKIELTALQLKQLIGSDTFDYLFKTFDDKPNEIVIRRCQAHGKLINFHTDESKKTMQVALSDDSEYEGGKLLYATKGQIYCPRRQPGTVSIHDNTVVHGVSWFESGIRYALFLLKKS